jgi:hypothetical protein
MSIHSIERWTLRWLTELFRVSDKCARQTPSEAEATEAILRDIYDSMGDMALITRPHAGPQAMMPRRMQDLGIDPVYVALAQPETYQTLQDVCTSCRHWRRCARDLARGDASSGLATYCGNAEILDRLLIKRCKDKIPARCPH